MDRAAAPAAAEPASTELPGPPKHITSRLESLQAYLPIEWNMSALSLCADISDSVGKAHVRKRKRAAQLLPKLFVKTCGAKTTCSISESRR